MSDLIDEYLELMARELRGPVIESHRTLLETEDHLRLSSAALVNQGMTEEEAQRQAISQFGSVNEIAQGHNAEVGVFTFKATLRSLIVAVIELTSAGLVTIGVSAVVAYALSRITSVQTVFGLPPSAMPTAQQCSYWLSIHPAAANCQQAGTWETAGDSTMLLGGVGVIGLLLYFLLRVIRRTALFSVNAVPTMLTPAIATAMFFLASIGLLVVGQGNGVIQSVWGQGMWYSESATAFAASLISAYFLLRAIRVPIQNVHDEVDGK